MTKLFNNIKSRCFGIFCRLGALCLLTAFATSCNLINEELDACPQEYRIRFVYDYNMERANAFYSQVDCISLYIFDRNGNLIDKITEDTEVLADENYRMVLDLEPGTYSFIALGGSTCHRNSFHVTEPGHQEKRTGISMRLPLNEGSESSAQLHDLFFGELGDVTFHKDKVEEVTLPMIKDTNSIQVVLQELDSPYIVDVDDYEFHIEADNALLGHDNVTVSTGGMKYKAHTLENRMAGYASTSGSILEEDEDIPVQVAVSEFHTSRLMTQNAKQSYIVVKAKDTGAEVIRVPLLDYMAMTRHVGYSWIQSDQEYFDRQSTWSFMFFLEKGKWVQNRVAVNHWVLRFNHAHI